MAGKIRNGLIIIWSVVCFSGAAAFLFEMLGPGSGISPVDSRTIAVTLGFWLLVWAGPVAALLLFGRAGSAGGKEEDGSGS